MLSKKTIPFAIGGLLLLVAGIAVFLFLRRSPLDNGPANVPRTVSNLDTADQGEPTSAEILHAAGSFANGQPFARFRAEDFEAIFPDWQNVDVVATGTTPADQVFVTNEGCNIIIRPIQITQGSSYRNYIEESLSAAEQYNPTFTRREISDASAIVDAEIPLADATLRNMAYNYLTSKGRSCGIAFVAEKSNFEKACGPYVDEIVKSVVVR